MSLYQQAKLVVGSDPQGFMDMLDRTLQTHGRSHGQLARAAGVDPTLLSKWFTGKKAPSEWSRLRLDDALQALIYGG